MNLLPQVEPHAAKLEACADAMEAAGIGGDPNNGHATQLRRMAAQMRADAVQGRMPSSIHAAATKNSAVTATLRACAESGVAVPATGRFGSLEALNQALDTAFGTSPSVLQLHKRLELKGAIYAAGMVVEEEAINVPAVRHAARLLEQCGIAVPTRYKLTVSELNAEMAKVALSPLQRIEIKVACDRAGLLDTEGTEVVAPLPKPGINVARSIFAQLDLDPPPLGQKVSLGAVNRAIREKRLSVERSIQIKSTLHAAGVLQD